MLPVEKPWPDPKYFFAAPTRPQAKDIAWDDLKALTPPNWIKSISETELKITTIWNSSIQLFGLEKAQRMEGRGYDGGGVDERADVKPKAISISIMPALADRNGWLWQSGVPKRDGVGAASFNKEFAQAAESGVIEGTNDRAEAYAWESATVMSEEQLAFFRATMDEKDFNEQFRAMIETIGGAVFHAFGPHNIAGNPECPYDRIQYNPSKAIIIGCDFNVDPMCWVLCHAVNGELHQFDEIWLRNTNTPAALEYLVKRYRSHESGWWIYGDASGKARKTSASASDYKHIMSVDELVGKRLNVPKANPAIKDRMSSCNALFKSADDHVRYFVSPTCVKTIEDLQARAYKEGTSILNDGAMVGHITDALGYVIHSRYPQRLGRGGSQKVGLF